MLDKYKIVSDGRITTVYDHKGEKLRNVTRIEINQEADKPVIAHITLIAVMPAIEIDMTNG